MDMVGDMLGDLLGDGSVVVVRRLLMFLIVMSTGWLDLSLDLK